MRSKKEIEKLRVQFITHLIQQGLSVEELAQYFNMDTAEMVNYLKKNSLSAQNLHRELTNDEVMHTSFKMQEQMWHLRENGWADGEVLELLNAPDWVQTCEELT